MARLASQAAQLLRTAPGVTRTGIYGGIFAHSAATRRAFTEALQAEMPEAGVGAPALPPQLGAVVHLLSREGAPDASVLQNIQASWKEMCS